MLATDVEYRIHLIIQEARKFMINGKRQTLIPEDIEFAMEALNVEVSIFQFNSTS
jgi:transcription initiation factor TFIID subunit 6